MAIVTSYYVGLDYHLDAIRVCVLDQGGYECVNRSVPNEVTAVMELMESQQWRPWKPAVARVISPRSSTSGLAGT